MLTAVVLLPVPTWEQDSKPKQLKLAAGAGFGNCIRGPGGAGSELPNTSSGIGCEENPAGIVAGLQEILR